jgi:hypothetical protein
VSIGKIKVISHKIKMDDASSFPYCHPFYILKGVKVGYFSPLAQPFSPNSEFNTSTAHCCANQF